jgi:hypothetical protein
MKKLESAYFPKDLEPYIIGLWRFHVAGEERLWCLTYRFKGCYYDTWGKKSPELAFAAMRKSLVTLKRKKRKK